METHRQSLLADLMLATREHQRAIDALDDVVAKHLGVNRTDLRTLDVLFDGPASPGVLATAIGLSPAAMTAALDRLETRGYLRRVRHPEDRRRVTAELTELTRQLAARIYGPIAQEGSAMMTEFSDDELVVLHRYLRADRDLQDRHRARLAAAARPSE